jgi:putative membrane protein
MKLTLAAIGLMLAAGSAVAQAPATTRTTTDTVSGAQTPSAAVNQSAQTTTSPSPSAIQTKNTTSRTAAAPVPGRNSFTHGEATRRIAAAGFTDVKALKKDGKGVWRGQATRDGAEVKVALDYQGNVVAE